MTYRRIVLQRDRPADEQYRVPRRRRLDHSHSPNITITYHASCIYPRGSVYQTDHQGTPKQHVIHSWPTRKGQLATEFLSTFFCLVIQAVTALGPAVGSRCLNEPSLESNIIPCYGDRGVENLSHYVQRTLGLPPRLDVTVTGTEEGTGAWSIVIRLKLYVRRCDEPVSNARNSSAHPPRARHALSLSFLLLWVMELSTFLFY